MSAVAIVSALAAAQAMILWRPSGRWLTRCRLGRGESSPPARPALSVIVVAGVGVVLFAPRLAAVSLPHVILALTVGGVATFVVRVIRVGRARLGAAARSAAVAESIGLMAAELRAGNLPQRVLAGLAPDFDFLVQVNEDIVAGLTGAAA